MAEEPGQENRDAPSNEDKPSRRRLIGLAIAGAVLGAILLVVFLWVWVHPTDPTEKKDFIQAVGVLLAALAALGGLYFTRTSTKDQLEQARKSQEQTQRLTEQGQITDRFTRAIDQLGKVDENNNKLFEIRIGGIYALERIARESEEDYEPIMEVLTAYVRQHAPWRPEESEPPEVPPLHPDIQAIMTVIRRRARSMGHGELEPLDLHRTSLRKANLRKANLREANLREANLREANLEGANLEGAYLEDAYLRGANLEGANLRGAGLERADLWATKFMGADFTGAFLNKANLQWGSLHRAVLSEANLWAANLSKRDLTEANLRKANLTKANLTEANLTEADLRGADLRGADLSRARGFIQTQLEKAIGDETTALPPHLKPPAYWGVKPDEQVEGD